MTKEKVPDILSSYKEVSVHLNNIEDTMTSDAQVKPSHRPASQNNKEKVSTAVMLLHSVLYTGSSVFTLFSKLQCTFISLCVLPVTFIEYKVKTKVWSTVIF